LLGTPVQRTKQAEGAGEVGRVCLTEAAHELARDQFKFEPGSPGHLLVVDDLTSEGLGEYEISPTSRRMASSVLMDRSVVGLVAEIEKRVQAVEPVASYLPRPILNLVVESAARRTIPPTVVDATLVMVNLIGLSESADQARPDEVDNLLATFARAFALINAAAESRGGVLKNITYHLAGSDMLIYFGVPNAHVDDSLRAASAALAIRDLIARLPPPTVGGREVALECQIGLARGPVFAAEIGEPRGRREFNVLGDSVNTAARLMGRAVGNRILITETIQREIAARFHCQSLGPMRLKGKAAPAPIFALREATDSKG